MSKRDFKLACLPDGYSIIFNAMASPCEILIQSKDLSLVNKIAITLTQEIWRIEDKYNRYDKHSVCSLINNRAGQSVDIDEETYLLLNFAEQCYQLSEGLFDISSGVLRKAWFFDGSDNLPSNAKVFEALKLVGWRKIKFDQQQVTLADKMEIDFGGIGKEYAVDRAIILAKQITNEPVLVNLGGDLAVTRARLNNEAWHVAIERPSLDSKLTDTTKQDMIISLKQGALATSGDARRFLLKDGKRYGHILNAKTGWPIDNAPRSITVVAPQCIQAGILATLSLLQGMNAEKFLTEQEIKFWVRR